MDAFVKLVAAGPLFFVSAIGAARRAPGKKQC